MSEDLTITLFIFGAVVVIAIFVKNIVESLRHRRKPPKKNLS
jgi:hypothetical protein